MNKPLTIAFVIYRLTSLRLAATVIIEARKRGWQVEIWLDQGSDVSKSYHGAPQENELPEEVRKGCAMRTYHGWEGLRILANEAKVDVIVNNIPLRGMGPADWNQEKKKPLIVLHDGAPLDWVHNIFKIEEFMNIDFFAISTQYWIEETLRYLKTHLATKGIIFTQEHEDHFLRNVRLVSWSLIDQIGKIDEQKTREEYNIPPGKRVVTYCNWTQGLKDVSTRAAVFSEKNALKRFSGSFKRDASLGAALTAMRDPGVWGVCRSLKNFCIRNNAVLIGRFRERDRHTEEPAELKHLDLRVYDDSYYPLTILKLLKISDLSIGYLSASVRESVASRTPHATFDLAGLGTMPICDDHVKPGGMWNYRGMVRNYKNRNAIQWLKKVKLEDIEVDDSAYRAYFRQYVGLETENHSAIILEELERSFQ